MACVARAGQVTRALVVLALLAGCSKIFGLEHVPPPAADAAPDVGTWTHVTAGIAGTCGIRDDHTLYCWGRNDFGELGTGTTVLEVDTPAQVPGSWQAIATQYYTTCGIQTDGTLWCWGANENGEAGSGAAAITAPQQLGADHYTAVTTGFYFGCALRSDDRRIACWGYNGHGEIGTGDGVPSITPRLIDSTLTFTSVSAGQSHTCAIATDGTLWCWGYGDYGQLGAGDGMSHLSPVQVGTDQWLDVAGGAYHTCGVRSDGKLRCWGYGPDGELGNPTSNTSLTPQPVGVDADGWASVDAVAEHTCARRTDGSLWCWGENDSLQLANPVVPVIDPVPFQVTGGPASWIELGLGKYHLCGVGDDHALWCAGAESGGRMGDGSGSIITPAEVMTAGAQIAAAPDATCVIDTGGKRWCWGDNSYGQLGDGTRSLRDQPTQADPGGPTLAMGFYNGCVIDATSHLRCWGSSPDYEIDPGKTLHLAAIDVQAGLAPWSAVALGYHTCAITGAGALYCWGYNGYGEADGSLNPYVQNPSPVAGTWTAIANGAYHTCGVASTGVYCWGYGTSGQLGNGAFSNSLAPVAVSTTLTTGKLFAADDDSCLISGTTLACWGHSGYGELGTGSADYYDTATVIPGSYLDMSLGNNHMCAIATDHTLWCSGHNAFGELGDGTFTDRLAPVQIGSDTWQSVAVGDYHTCAVRSDGTVMCWGDNGFGQLGVPHLRQPFFRLR